ncbi:hypothetical protein KIW84_042090 [Lathyrus oleraceus]|uniref:Rab3-GAP regulatory subunit N-terminal domain-containing protein n=1 Tax=Pisum sativum TaxID=3888 RepID=A0A9D5AS59_PEA|nr:hypothetical protein KIW84_042090 [Pisum sativum]
MTDAKAAKAILLPQGTSSIVQPVIQNAMDIFTSSGTAQASFNSENTSPQKSPKKSAVKPQPFARASPLTCIKDHPRKGEKLTSSPSGTLAAITGSLGRILLLDTQALVVVHLWKGYRDVSCLFMEMLP